jgi:hypothetical protein
MICTMKTDQNKHTTKKILTKIMLGFLSIWLITDILVFHLVANPFFWVMAIIEVGIGILWVITYYQFKFDKKYTRSNFWFLPLSIIGIGAPIVIYLLIPSSGRVDASLIVFFIAINTIDLFHHKMGIFRKNQSN